MDFKELFSIGAFAADYGFSWMFFNPELLHSAPIALSAASNAWLKSLNGSVQSLVTINHPFPKEKTTQSNQNSDEVRFFSSNYSLKTS